MSTDEGTDTEIVALLKAVLASLHEERDWLRTRIQAEMAVLRVEMANRRNHEASAKFDLAEVRDELAGIRAELAAPPRAAITPSQQQ